MKYSPGVFNKGAEIPHGVGLFNLGRQMGGLIGIAFLATFLEHHMALSRTVIVSNLGQGSPVVTQALQGMEQRFASRGMAPEQPPQPLLGRWIAW